MSIRTSEVPVRRTVLLRFLVAVLLLLPLAFASPIEVEPLPPPDVSALEWQVEVAALPPVASTDCAALRDDHAAEFRRVRRDYIALRPKWLEPSTVRLTFI